jgi:PAS domain S-box-containing protein
MHVLVVDDEADARELLQPLFESCGARVTVVASAAEALEAVRQLHPDVLVSDIAMPEEDGYSLIQKVRALRPEQGGRIPAVALTGYAQAEDRKRALLAGFQIHVPKPVEPAELVAVVWNLSERKRAEETRLLLAAIVESSEDAIIGFTLDGMIVSWNVGAEKIFGYSGEEVMGRSVSVLVPPDRAEEAAIIFKRVKRGQPVTQLETTQVRKDGKQIHVSITVSPIRDARGKITGVSVTVRDFTDRKRVQEDLERHARELERSNAELEQFAYVSSHDLQEPLRMVTLYTQLLEKRYHGRLDADANEFIGYIVEGAGRMHRLINDLLDYSRVGSHGREFEPTDCEAVLAQVLGSLRPAIEEAKGVLTHDPLPSVMADGFQLTQLFQNLIGNALKFRGEGPPQVHVSARSAGKRWVFSVHDNGIGVDPRYAERIFVIFQRLHNRQEYPGTGIGLAICKKIVERHGGRIWVESEPGKGTTFYFDLPRHGRSRPKRERLRPRAATQGE